MYMFEPVEGVNWTYLKIAMTN